MNKIFKIAAVSTVMAVAASLTSCDDFLDQPARGQQNLDNYYQTEEECEAAVVGCYQAVVFDDWWQTYYPWLQSEVCTDNAWMGNTTQGVPDLYHLAYFMPTGQDSGPISNLWYERYIGILRCNLAIQYIPDSPMSDTDKKNQLVAEARFLRGFFYFELAKNFGGLPIVTGLMDPEDGFKTSRATLDETWEFIKQDFRAAVNGLPSVKKLSSSQAGRATRGAALAFLGKVLVYQEKWQAAADTLGLLVNEGDYNLMPSFGDVFDPDYPNCDESIFASQHIYSDTYSLGGSLGVISGNRNAGDQDGWGYCTPTAWLEKQFLDEGDTERLRWTIIKNGDTEIAGEDNFADLVDKQGNRNGDGSYAIISTDLKGGRIFRKYFIPLAKRPDVYDKAKIPQNWPIYRYSDALLLYAEALNELGRDGEACTQLNKVRERVFLNDINLAGNDLRKAIRKERQLELAGEFQRLYDIRRWKEDNGKTMMENLFTPTGSFVVWNTDTSTADAMELANQNEQSNKGYNFNVNRDLLWPVPLDEIERANGVLVQNPGW
jgi:hypothetical protein